MGGHSLTAAGLRSQRVCMWRGGIANSWRIGLLFSVWCQWMNVASVEAKTCDDIASEITTKYSRPGCSSFAEQSTNYRRVSVEASSWCREGLSCRAELHADVTE